MYKPQVYAKIGVKELFLYDPTADYLTPPLQGFHLAAEGQTPIEPEESGQLESGELGIRLWLEDGRLAMADSQTGQRLLTEAEAERAGGGTGSAGSGGISCGSGRTGIASPARAAPITAAR